jgi:hypothetical protein
MYDMRHHSRPHNMLHELQFLLSISFLRILSGIFMLDSKFTSHICVSFLCSLKTFSVRLDFYIGSDSDYLLLGLMWLLSVPPDHCQNSTAN